MSSVLEELANSPDPIERDFVKAMKAYQDIKASKGMTRSMGYEPRDVKQNGVVSTLESRVRSHANGFDVVPAEFSYEAIVVRYPDRFAADVVEMAKERLAIDADVTQPTADNALLDQRVRMLLARERIAFPKGNRQPNSILRGTLFFVRDPTVKAYALKLANGACASCGHDAPFQDSYGISFLEVHHLKPLSAGGSDTVGNTVAVCPNCHRALHYASDADERADAIYKRKPHLIRE